MINLKSIKLGFTAIALTFLTSCTMAQSSNTAPTNLDPDNIVGTWRSAAQDSEMEIYKTGNVYSAKMLAGWGNDMYESDGKTPAKDTKNPNPELRNRQLLNLVFITDVSYKNGEYTGGKLYMARVGKTLKCEMKFEGEKLSMKIHSVIGPFNVTKTWSRIK